jgi:hypothetical protein
MELLEDGVAADVVKGIALHKSVETTMRYDRRRTSLKENELYDLERRRKASQQS